MISIFTPTYNRAYILPQLYESLKRQTCTKFEWIIIDGGSEDNTEFLVHSWINEENKFSIIYKQENGGKHVAINYGVQLANYEWFFIVDSDDYLKHDAVEKIIEWVDMGINDTYAGVSGTRCYSDGTTIGGDVKFTGRYIDCKNNERNRYGLGGDKAEVYRTPVLKKYPFPVFTDERFLTECAVWDKIATDGFLIRWFNEPLVVCEYLEDGLTASNKKGELTLNNFNGYTYATVIRLEAYGGLNHYKIICEYIINAWRKGLGIKEIANRLNENILLIYIMSFAIFLMYPGYYLFMEYMKGIISSNRSRLHIDD